MREEITRLVHDIDSLLAVGNCHMHVQTKNETRACNLLHVFNDCCVAFVNGDELIHPV